MQTLALLHDSLRLLMARRLFWITMLISGLLVVAYGSIGFDDRGVSILFGAFHFEDPRFTSDSPWARVLLLGIFTNFVVPVWLGWGAVILGLISTSSTFPDMMSEGAVDLVLSKPLSRVKLVLVKYAGALLFVGLQTLVFCGGVFLITGLRLGEWNWMIFAGAAIVVIFFSYLFAFHTLVAIVTRSTIAALLLTMLFWFALFIAQSTEQSLSGFHQQQLVEIEDFEARIATQKIRLDRARNPSGLRESLGAALTSPDQIERTIASLEAEQESKRRTAQALEAWHDRSLVLMAVLPKNQETIALLDRWLIRDANMTMQDIVLGSMNLPPEEEPNETPEQPDPGAEPEASAEQPETTADRRGRHEEMTRTQIEAAKREEKERREKPAAFIIGTSLGFEIVILAVACFIFARRDF